MGVCVYVCVYIYIYMYTHIQSSLPVSNVLASTKMTTAE